MVARIHVRFRRPERYGRKLLRLRVDRLTADDDNLGVTRDLTGGRNNMFELNTIHR